MFSPVLAKTAALTAMRFVLSLGAGLFKHQKADSLVSFTKSTRVEPITLIDQRATAVPYLTDVLQAVNSLFIGYYLQAIAIMVNVGNINVTRLLDTLNPERDVADAANAYIVDRVNDRPSLLSLESYQTGLPVPMETVSLEDEAVKARDLLREHVKQLPSGVKDELRDRSDGYDGGAMRNLANQAVDLKARASIDVSAAKEVTNLSVGKLVDVTIKHDKQELTLPISVRLIATIMSSSIMTHILGDGSRNITAKERWHGWRSGQLEFIKDIILAQDLIDERRKALMKDDTGAYAEILRRRAGNAASGVMSATPSIGTASNIVVMTQQTAHELETSIGGRLADARTRKKVFDNTYVILMVVIDTEYEMVTIYHRGIALPTKLSAKELKVTNKGTGPSVSEILQAYQLGNTPNL